MRLNNPGIYELPAMNEVEKKLAAARTRLILDKPFLGALALRLPLKAADPSWCPTSATDARTFFYNPEYIGNLSTAEVQFVLAHEALHCGLSHFARRQHRVKHLWDVACDYAINPLLLSDGLKPPPGVLRDFHFENMTAEEIYPCIDENTNDQPMDKHVYDQPNQDSGENDQSEPGSDDKQPGTDGESPDPEDDEQDGQASQAEPDPEQRGARQPPPLAPDEQEELAVQWQQRLAGAAQQAMQAGKLGSEFARLVDHLLEPRLPWRMLLARYMTALERDDYSYMRPSRREGEAILPSLRSTQVDIVVAVDTSGSISLSEINEFIAEIDAIKGQVRARLTLLACDRYLAPDGPWVYEPWEETRLPVQLGGGGGTDFRPVFDWADQQTPAPDLLVYFTDAEGAFPEQEPAFSTLWLVKGKEKVPWGQRIQLN